MYYFWTEVHEALFDDVGELPFVRLWTTLNYNVAIAIQSYSSMSAAAVAAPRKKVRNLLSAYYQLPAATDAAKSDANDRFSFSAANDPFSSSSFSAASWFQNIVEKKGVPALLRSSNELETEIRTLDSELQTIVYENYSKFLKATDTISDLHSAVQGQVLSRDCVALDSSMARLDAVFQGQLLMKLGPGNERVVEKLEREKGLRAVANLLSVPKRLREALEKGDLFKAARIYCKSVGALKERSGKLERFQIVLKEVGDVVGELKLALEERSRGGMEEITVQ